MDLDVAERGTGLPRWWHGKEPTCQCRRQRDTGSIPGLGRSPGGGHSSHSSVLAWRIPWTEEPSGLYSPWGHKETDTTEATERLCMHARGTINTTS